MGVSAGKPGESPKVLRSRFWAEIGLGLASALFAVLTLLWRDWVEIVFRVDPDHHSGSLEWTIVAAAVAVTLITFAAARFEWRRASTGAATASA
ncbi:MAG TPA: ABC transporter permease [Actinomycetota bacterium]|nr:ABC transporter permease [Actinomycetota bacterium]